MRDSIFLVKNQYLLDIFYAQFTKYSFNFDLC